MNRTVLILDDNKLFIRFLKSVLPKQRENIDFVFADTPASARQKIEGLSDVYCLVTDYNLGDEQINGIQFANEVKNRFPNIKIILISTLMDKSLKAKASQNGIYLCASKFNELYQWIKFIDL